MPPRRPRRRANKKKAPRMKGGLVKAVRKIATQEALKTQETKYVTNFSVINNATQRVTNYLQSVLLPGNYSFFQQAMPGIPVGGATSSQMVGQKLRLVNGYTKFHFNFIDGWNVNQDIILKLFCVHSKTAKSFTNALALPTKDLLRVGNGNQCDWDPITTGLDARTLNHLNINNLAFTGKIHTFRFTKNTGSMNFNSNNTPVVPGDVPNLSSKTNYHEFVWNWTDGKKILNYDGTGPVGFPTNYCPMWGVVAYYPDGSPYPNPVQPPVNQILPIEIVTTNHMWYKDS